MSGSSETVRDLLRGADHLVRSRASRLEVFAVGLAFQLRADGTRLEEVRLEAIRTALGSQPRSLEVRLADRFDWLVQELGEESALERLRVAEPEFDPTTLEAFLVVQSLVQPLETQASRP